MLTLATFEEAAKKVKEVTQETKLIYSHHFSKETGNEVYLKPENSELVPIKFAGPTTRLARLPMRNVPMG